MPNTSLLGNSLEFSGPDCWYGNYYTETSVALPASVAAT